MGNPTFLSETGFCETGIMMAACGSALQLTLITLARQHDNRAGPWLDDLQAECERAIKGMNVTTSSFEIEAHGIRLGLDIVAEIFRGVRDWIGAK